MFLFLLVSDSLCFAQSNTEKAMEEAKRLGDQQNKRDVTKFREKIKKDIHYPREESDGVPRVEELSYYRSGRMEDAAILKAQSDRAGKLVRDGSITRPNYSFDPKRDPTFKRYDEISKKAHSLTETYSGCTEIPVGKEDVTRTKEQSCFVFGKRERVSYSCLLKREVSCSNGNANSSRPYYVADFRTSGDPITIASMAQDRFSIKAQRAGRCQWGRFGVPCCKHFKSQIRFYVDDLDEISHFGFERVGYDDWLDIEVNGSLVFRAIGPHQGTFLAKKGQECEHNRLWWGSHFTAKSYLRQGWNTLAVLNQVKGGGEIDLEMRLERRYSCREKDSYKRECSDGRELLERKKLRSRCVLGPMLRKVRGSPIYRSCWEWKEEYSAFKSPVYTREALCRSLASNGCVQVAARCEDQQPTFCTKQRLTYSCPYQDAARHVTLCGDVLQCQDGPDGNCAEEFKQQFNKDNTEDFKQAATGLSIASEIIKNLDKDDGQAFKGYSRRCGNTSFGASNCCNSSGWAHDLGLAKCNAGEKELGLARESSKAAYVGSYKSGGVIDRRNYEVYCIFPSKLARIIVEQGRRQKGLSFGSARSPDCRGFTLQELEELNFDAMDFSEFYSDVMAKAKAGSTPTSGEAISDIHSKVKGKMQRKSQ